MNSTPVNWALIIRLTALLPPPPSPTPLIFAACGASSSSNSGRLPRSFSILASLFFASEGGCAPLPKPPPVDCGGKTAARTTRPRSLYIDGSRPGSRGCRLEESIEPVGEAAGGAAEEAAAQHSPAASVENAGRARWAGAGAVEGQADARRIDRALDDVGQPAHRLRQSAPYGQIEDRLGQLGDPFHNGRPARDDDAAGGSVLEPDLGHLARHQREDLLQARLNDLGQ